MNNDKWAELTIGEKKQIFRHVATTNDELGELHISMEKMRTELKDYISQNKGHILCLKTDVSWLKKSYWVIVTTSVSALFIALVKLAFPLL